MIGATEHNGACACGGLIERTPDEALRSAVVQALRTKRVSAGSHTVGQIAATIRDHGGCWVEYERRESFVVGESVARDPDTVVLLTDRTA